MRLKVALPNRAHLGIICYNYFLDVIWTCMAAIPDSLSLKASIAKDEAIEALSKTISKPVQLAYKALVDYDAEEEASDCPHPPCTLSFKKGDYLHMKKQYNSDWWIGRVVGESDTIGFMPSESKLKTLLPNLVVAYQGAPIMRPVVFVGPSNKQSELTQLLQKGLVDFMKERFAGRLKIVKPQVSVPSMNDKQMRTLLLDVRNAGASLKLVFLDCDANFPDDLEQTSFHPLVVYIQISRHKVLERLLKESSQRRREAQLNDAHRLYDDVQRTPCPYSLVITESNFDDAAQNLELFLESYWASTRSVVDPKELLQTESTTVDN